MSSLRVGACLSLSGRFAPFGRQAARGLEAWQSLDGAADLVIADDRSDRRALEKSLPDVAARSDVVLGPYSTYLATAAGRIAAESGFLLWNHGGAGDDAGAAHPGHVVSVLTPASRYAWPFVRLLAGGELPQAGELVIAGGSGSFSRRVCAGAADAARRLGVPSAAAGPAGLRPAAGSREWALLCAGSFGDDVQRVAEARRMPGPPRLVCAVAAGVRGFARAAGDGDGTFGIAQWFPGMGGGGTAALGPAEEDFLRAYQRAAGVLPDYPAAQAAAGAALAAHCARLAGRTDRDAIWRAACALETTTLFGGFRIDPRTGTQAAHETVLLRWASGQLRPA